MLGIRTTDTAISQKSLSTFGQDTNHFEEFLAASSPRSSFKVESERTRCRAATKRLLNFEFQDLKLEILGVLDLKYLLDF